MLVDKLGALVRRSKTLNLTSHLKGSSPSPKASNEQCSLLHSLRSSHCGNLLISRYSTLYGFKCMFKNLTVPSKRKMTTSAAVLDSVKAEAVNSGIKSLVVGPHAKKRVGIWLFCCAFWVFSLVHLGGIIHETRSALSMTDRKFKGERPQFTDEEWNKEFEKYMQSPGYKCVKSLSDFKYIHWLEYAHRMMGRGLGIVFALPFAYFLAKGYITRSLGLRLSVLCALGGAQGLVGCSMVKSGLEEPASQYVQPTVSPYRHVMNITSAYILYGGIVWTALSVFMPEPPNGSLEFVRGATRLRQLVLPACALLGVTALSGASVASVRRNAVGHAFSTSPKLGDIFNMERLKRNFFENTSNMQLLTHRIFATTTIIYIASLVFTVGKIKMHPLVEMCIGHTVLTAFIMVALEVYPLSRNIPYTLASDHQVCATLLMTCLIVLAHFVRKPSPHVLKSLASLPNIKS